MAYIWVALGGALGTIGRYQISGWVAQRFGANPLGTFTVNIVGAFIIGFFLVLADERVLISPDTRRFFAIGVLGGFTTFSTLTYETMSLVEDGALLSAAANVLGSIVIGLIAVYIGMTVARLF